MEKLWAARFCKPSDKLADDFNSSIQVDSRMYLEDITGSMAHTKMLAESGIIKENDASVICKNLEEILQELQTEKLNFNPNAEDIHMFVETELTQRIGDIGKKLHTARSRNDQVALDLRMYLRTQCKTIQNLLKQLLQAILQQAKQNTDAILPGYTHLQRAQPIFFSQHLLAYAAMFQRDTQRLQDAVKRMNVSPLGACALAGTGFPINQQMVALALGFDSVCSNSIDAVSDRDFCVEILSALSLIMTHLSRFSEEIILWCSWEFGFIELDDSYTTGSSIMPQKKNPDMAELVRGKTGRVYGDLMAMLTILKGLPLAYNKDMQEDKEVIFDGMDTVQQCLSIFIPMITTMKSKKENMYMAAQQGFINATDLADYLVNKGMEFRNAYKVVGKLVAKCIAEDTILEKLPYEEYKKSSELFEQDVYSFIEMQACANRRNSQGGTGQASIQQQLQALEEYLAQ